jgi:hypothetical protein
MEIKGFLVFFKILFFGRQHVICDGDVFAWLYTVALFAWLISHQLAVIFSQNKPATNNQPIVLFSQNKPAPAISHQPTEQAV